MLGAGKSRRTIVDELSCRRGLELEDVGGRGQKDGVRRTLGHSCDSLIRDELQVAHCESFHISGELSCFDRVKLVTVKVNLKARLQTSFEDSLCFLNFKHSSFAENVNKLRGNLSLCLKISEGWNLFGDNIFGGGSGCDALWDAVSKIGSNYFDFLCY